LKEKIATIHGASTIRQKAAMDAASFMSLALCCEKEMPR